MDDTYSSALSWAEQYAVTCTDRGEQADLSCIPDIAPVVCASFPRALLLGLPLEPAGAAGGRVCAMRAPGLRIKGARVEAPMDRIDRVGAEDTG